MNSSIQVRPAIPGDLPLIHQLIRELAVYEKLEADCTGTLEQLRATLFGPSPFAKVLLAFADERPAGAAIYFFSYSTFAARPLLYLEDLFVRPELRGRGVGKKLFLELERIARAQGCARMEWSVLDWNQTALDFYDRLGARPQKAWVKYSLPLGPNRADSAGAPLPP